ncbi:hypothetical protein GTO91_16760 [Heliobacterium undosum]|uniref:Competence protein CoiA n=1 Tax=Heliomicrobium undosum TaxID=121734 RepID=A0A845L4X3_9FIRM|nr:competence protein CoiA family protein [Heliomicrobium undosum]MZP31353.1 hypothetical protein [Heliomicrobium undosum]
MLTALLDGQKISATDPRWDNRKEELRALCNERAVCPICGQPVICRFGQVYIHHFGHRNKSDCPGSNESAEYMRAKALLYQFLLERIGNAGTVELEYPLPALKSTCGIHIRLNDGRRRAVEFFCGQWKSRELQARLDYFKANDIDTMWLISMSRFPDFEPDGRTVVFKSPAERALMSSSGLDKFCVSDWFERWQRKVFFKLPADEESGCSLCFFDTETKEIKFMRSLILDSCVSIFRVGATLKGTLDNIRLSDKKHVWYLEQEEIWKERWLEVKQSMPVPKTALQNISSMTKPSPANRFAITTPLFSRTPVIKQPQKPVELPKESSERYHCELCGGIFSEGDMSIYQLSTKRGKCKKCMYS